MADALQQAMLWLWHAFVAVLVHLCSATVLTGVELFILVGPLLLAALLSHLVSRRLEQRVVQVGGQRSYIYLLGWLGTPVHELGHALMCLLFRHEIIEIKLFAPDPKSGQLGYVHHAWDSRSIVQQMGNLFIALGPLVLGGAVLYLLSLLMLEGVAFRFGHEAAAGVYGLADIPAATLTWIADMARGVLAFLGQLSPGRVQTWLFLYLVLAIGSHVNLSPADLETGKGGFLVIVVVLFVANVVMTLFAQVPMAPFHIVGRYLGMLSSLIFACTILMLPVLAVLELIGALLERRGQRRAGPRR